jgi:hypothetical protein
MRRFQEDVRDERDRRVATFGIGDMRYEMRDTRCAIRDSFSASRIPHLVSRIL